VAKRSARSWSAWARVRWLTLVEICGLFILHTRLYHKLIGLLGVAVAAQDRCGLR
jgi:hypothetical protein